MARRLIAAEDPAAARRASADGVFARRLAADSIASGDDTGAFDLVVEVSAVQVLTGPDRQRVG